PTQREQAELCDDVAQHATSAAMKVGNRGLGERGRAGRSPCHLLFLRLSPARHGHLRHFATRAEVEPQSEYAEVERSKGPDKIHDPHFLTVANLINCNQNSAKECDGQRRQGDRVKHRTSCPLALAASANVLRQEPSTWKSRQRLAQSAWVLGLRQQQ